MNILGCPVKVGINSSIYFPVNYLHVYGIDMYYDLLIRQQFESCFIFRPFEKRLLKQNETIEKVRGGNVFLPKHWLTENKLKPGDSYMYLIGIDDGLLISSVPRIIF